jgi:hypothetical protein
MTDTSSSPAAADAADFRRRRITIAVTAGLVLLVGLVLWLALKGDDSKEPASAGQPPRIVTSAELRQIAEGLGFPLYWAGPLKRSQIEYTAASNGRYFVRYLTGGAPVGDPRRAFVTVGTYPQDGAYKTVVSASKVPTATSATTKSGALVVNDSRRPSSVYFAFPGAKFQVEVYAPSPARARRLVLDGTVRRVI